jgi:endonuclease/exonuclease/phosphatase family metal-dependent hydrolase
MMDIEPRLLTVGTFNIRGWSEERHDGINAWKNRAPFTITTINRMDADCLGLQEFSENKNLQFYRDKLPGRELHLGTRMDDGRFNPILYNPNKLRIQESGMIWLNQKDEPKPDWEAQETRSATLVVFEYRQTSSRHILFVNAHLDHRSELAQVEGTKKILQKVSLYPYPTLVVSDQNADIGDMSASYDLFLQAGFQEAFVSTNPTMDEEPPPTFHNFKGKDYSPPTSYGTRHIDWIMYKGFTPKSCSIVYDSQHQQPHYPSDHYPKVARLRVGQG